MTAVPSFPGDHLVLSAVIHDQAVAPPGWNKLAWVDDEGRPLIESHAPPELCEAAGMELRTCPYRDSRFHHEKPMNVSALHQVRQHWTATKEIYLGLRALLFPASANTSLSITELWRMSYLAFSVPPYLALSNRERGPVLPAWAAALFKTGLGLTPLTVMVLESRLAGVVDAAAQGRDVLEAADRHGTLIGPRHVCAGPPRMIVDILDFVIEPPRADAALQRFGDLLDDPAAFRAFGLELLNAGTACYAFFLARQYVTGDLCRAIRGTPDFDRLAPELQRLEEARVDPNVFPYIDLLDEFSDADKRELLRVIADLVEPLDGAPASARLGALARELADQWTRDDAGSGLERLLVVAVRLERCFLAMLQAAEASLRTSLGLEPFRGTLDHTTVDRLYPDHPRRVLGELLGAEVEITPTGASFIRGALRVET